MHNASLGYIGKKHLQAAIDTVLQHPLANAPRPLAFSVLRVPYFLEPDYDERKPHMHSNRKRLVKKWGGQQGWERQKNQHDLKGRGLEAGIPHFNLDRLAANSMASHRLIQYLGRTYGLDVSEAIYDVLNVYYFVDGHSLNDRPRLAQVVSQALEKLWRNDGTQRVPPTPEVLLEFLNGNEGRAEIEEAIATLYQMGVSGIPKFIIEGRSLVDGAARPDVFVRLFREIEERGQVAGGAMFGDILGVSAETIARGSHGLSEKAVA
jgi:predicted DsbA family dithiol-disulfide isomerase